MRAEEIERKVQIWCKRKIRSLILNKLRIVFVAHSGIEPLF